MSSSMKAGDEGVVLEKTLVKADGSGVLDITGATVVSMLVKKPDRTTVTYTGSLSGTGADGKVRVVTSSQIKFVAGHYQAQFYVEVGALKLHSDWFHFDVESNIL